MSSDALSSIPIHVEFGSVEKDSPQASIRAILVEIQQALRLFHETGKKHSIDLTALPLSEFETSKLLKLLGQGELSIRLSSLGESEIYESLFEAVWLIKHKNETDQVSALLIEVCAVPEIVLSQINDISSLTEGLQELIDGL